MTVETLSATLSRTRTVEICDTHILNLDCFEDLLMFVTKPT